MYNTICVNSKVAVLLIIAIIIVCIYQYTQTIDAKSPCPVCPSDSKKVVDVVNTEEPVNTGRHAPVMAVHPPTNISDPVKDYDRRKIHDPLEEPTRRVARHHIQPMAMRHMIDLPTRGYPDNYTQVGILVRTDTANTSNENRILRLFGRQEFPGSTRYQYYTAIGSSNDSIKVPIEITGNKELYDDDSVNVSVLNNEAYDVQLHKFDAPKYYPDIF
jgi:hypothetical protein